MGTITSLMSSSTPSYTIDSRLTYMSSNPLNQNMYQIPDYVVRSLGALQNPERGRSPFLVQPLSVESSLPLRSIPQTASLILQKVQGEYVKATQEMWDPLAEAEVLIKQRDFGSPFFGSELSTDFAASSMTALPPLSESSALIASSSSSSSSSSSGSELSPISPAFLSMQNSTHSSIAPLFVPKQKRKREEEDHAPSDLPIGNTELPMQNPEHLLQLATSAEAALKKLRAEAEEINYTIYCLTDQLTAKINVHNELREYMIKSGLFEVLADDPGAICSPQKAYFLKLQTSFKEFQQSMGFSDKNS